jgi:hypothetical protein
MPHDDLKAAIEDVCQFWPSAVRARRGFPGDTANLWVEECAELVRLAGRLATALRDDERYQDLIRRGAILSELTRPGSTLYAAGERLTRMIMPASGAADRDSIRL